MRDLREVVVLIVVADIVGKHVKGAIVGVGFLALFKHVVLCKEMASHGVETATHN